MLFALFLGFKQASPMALNRTNHIVAVAEPFVAFNQHQVYGTSSHSCISYTSNGFPANDPNFSLPVIMKIIEIIGFRIF